MGRGGTARLHANTCCTIIPPAESLLGNVIHHLADATSARRGGGRERHRIVQIDRWLRISLASLLCIPELILIKVVIGRQELPAKCLWRLRQRDKCQALHIPGNRKMLIHILHITCPGLSVTVLLHRSSYWLGPVLTRTAKWDISSSREKPTVLIF